MREICELAKAYKLKVIEDSAQGHGGEIDGQRCGSFGDIGVLVFTQERTSVLLVMAAPRQLSAQS